MQTPLPINPACASFLMERYPALTHAALRGLWMTAWWWIEGRVQPRFMVAANRPAALEVAALFRVQYMLTNCIATKQALNFAAVEALLPYQ